MNDEAIQPTPPNEEIAGTKRGERGFIAWLTRGKGKKYERFVVAALGSIPWIGGVLAAAAALNAEKDQERENELQRLWLEQHEEKMRDLGGTFAEIFTRLDGFGDVVQDRIQSPEYLALVGKSFRAWDEADTKDKREKIKKLITNAGAITLCPDDLIRLFLNWIEQYHEAHFMVIKEIYKNPGCTRGHIWDSVHGRRARENSSEADLFRYLIRDLSTGGVIRQARETDEQGRFVKKTHEAAYECQYVSNAQA